MRENRWVGSFFFQAEDGRRALVRSRGLGDVYKRQELARRAGRSDRVIRYWIKRGFIQYERDGLTPGARIIIPLEEAERVISQLPQGEIIESA